MQKSRPFGVIIATILMVIVGISVLINGIIVPYALPASIVIGILWFVFAWGLFTGKGWAWIITVILAIISAIFNILSIFSLSYGSVFSLIVNIIILYYMYRPNVKTWFGRGTGISV